MPASILAYDLECSSLNANFGQVLCCGYGYVDSVKVTVPSIHDYSGDCLQAEKKLLKDVSAIMLDADIWLGHYACKGRFDLNFLQTRLAWHGLPFLPGNHPQIDTWKIARDNLRLSSNRLATISDLLGTSEEKNSIESDQW